MKAQAEENAKKAQVEASKAAALAETKADSLKNDDMPQQKILLAAVDQKHNAITERKTANKAKKDAEEKLNKIEKTYREKKREAKVAKKAASQKKADEKLKKDVEAAEDQLKNLAEEKEAA